MPIRSWGYGQIAWERTANNRRRVLGFAARCPGALRARVRCLDHEGEEVTIQADGWYTRILQHEIDHLHGVLYLDPMLSRSVMTVDHLTRHWNDLPIAEVKRRLEIVETP
jgi:peptide deformylase